MSMQRFLLVCVLAILCLSDAASAQGIPPGVQIIPDLPYDNRFGASTTLDLYLPARIPKPVPVIVWIHGGGWELFSKGIWPGIVMVDKGFAVASINYRLSSEAKFPAQIYDCRAAVQWLRRFAKKYHLDPDHIGAWGESAGGHLAALLGTSGDEEDRPASKGNRARPNSRIQAVVDWFGPTDVAQWTEFRAAYPGLPADYPKQCIARLLGGSLENMREVARRANPITFASKDDPPFLIMHGDKDSLVPLSQSELLASALTKAGTQVEFKILPGKGHKTFSDAASLQMVERFFDKTLRNAADRKLENGGDGPRLVATYMHQANDGAPAPVQFYSNRRLGTPDGINTWSLDRGRGILYLCWYDLGSTTGVWVDECKLSKDGKLYQGRNQQGAIIRGKLESGSLRITDAPAKTDRSKR